jgi:nitrite reductase/ring-hydroxylating ferredoxin subunit
MSANPARPPPGAFIARFDDLPDPGARAFDFAEGEARFSLILARQGAAVFAYENVCPHAFYPLDRPDGRVVMQSERYLVCTAHGASFAVETGACVGGPCNGEGLQPIAVTLTDGDVRMGAIPRPDPGSDHRPGGA